MLVGLSQHAVGRGQWPRGARRRTAVVVVGLHLELPGLTGIQRIDGRREVQRELNQQAAQQDQRMKRQGEHAAQVVQVEQPAGALALKRNRSWNSRA